jgi:hypothetical protein
MVVRLFRVNSYHLPISVCEHIYIYICKYYNSNNDMTAYVCICFIYIYLIYCISIWLSMFFLCVGVLAKGPQVQSFEKRCLFAPMTEEKYLTTVP